MAEGRAHFRVRHDRLLRARLELGLTRLELSDRAQCSVSAIGYYESGERQPGVKALHRLAEALGRDVAWFLPEEGS